MIEVGLRVTKLRGDNGEIWYVRNGEVKRIGNLSQGWATAVRGRPGRRRRGPGPGPRGDRRGRRGDGQGGAWNELLWEPGRGARPGRRCCSDSMVVRVSAKTMPGKSLAVERELRWRIKRAFDAAGIRDRSAAARGRRTSDGRPTRRPAVAAPSALANPASPQSLAASRSRPRRAQPRTEVATPPAAGAAPRPAPRRPRSGRATAAPSGDRALDAAPARRLPSRSPTGNAS